MRRRLFFSCVWLAGFVLYGQAQEQKPFTVAVLPPHITDEVGGVSADTVLDVVEQALARQGLGVLPRARTRSAAPPVADLNFNPTCIEAQALGARVGSEGYVLVALRRGERSAPNRQTVIGGSLHLFAVATRTGQLVASEHLDFTESELGFLPTVAPLVTTAAGKLSAGWRTIQTQLLGSAGQTATCQADVDFRLADSPPGVTPPVPLVRPRPEPTNLARVAGVSATVGAEVHLTADGQVCEVMITRWAGYGLEAAVEKALRAVRFKPATRDGQPISARFLAEFNFRTVGSSLTAKPNQTFISSEFGLAHTPPRVACLSPVPPPKDSHIFGTSGHVVFAPKLAFAGRTPPCLHRRPASQLTG
ncbi:MAG: energy transducer TonB [Chloracidobacterium sp.]